MRLSMSEIHEAMIHGEDYEHDEKSRPSGNKNNHLHRTSIAVTQLRKVNDAAAQAFVPKTKAMAKAASGIGK